MNKGRMIRINKIYCDIIDGLILKGLINKRRAEYVEEVVKDDLKNFRGVKK